MAVVFLNYERGEMIARSGKLIEVYQDSFAQVWVEIEYGNSRLNLHDTAVVADHTDATAA